MNGLRLRNNPTASLAYRNLTQTQFNLNNTLQRLSSGLRINTAADDSAGSAISTRMNNQIQDMKQANENAQQANNLIQTAENGLNDINNYLQLGISNVTANGLRIDGNQVANIDQARVAITSLDYATDMVNQEWSYLGSMQNRLAFTMSNLTSQTQSIEAARSRIQDTDFAADAADTIALDHVRFIYEKMPCYHCFWRCHKRASKFEVFPCISAVNEERVTDSVLELIQ